MSQDKAIFMSQAFQKSSFGGFRGTHCLLKITKYWFLFYRLKVHIIYFSSLTGIWTINVNETTSFLNLCKIAKEFAIQEKGCISFSYTEYKDVEKTYLFFEEWRDQKAIDFHIAQWYFIEFNAISKPRYEDIQC
jgi:quinol monooxygenase YgiN